MPFFPDNLHQRHHHHSMIKTVTYEELTNGRAGAARIARIYFLTSTSPVLAFTIFGLFGMTAEARASYRRAFHTVVGWIGGRGAAHSRRKSRSSLSPIEFDGQSLSVLSGDSEIRCAHNLNHYIPHAILIPVKISTRISGHCVHHSAPKHGEQPFQHTE